MAKPSSSPPAKLLFSSLLSLSFLSLILLFLSKTTPPLPPSFSPATGLHNPFPTPPRIAYFVSGSGGDGPRVVRLLSAVYHPRNRYLLHLDRRASQAEREELAESVEAVDAFRAAGNVDVIGKADFVNSDGSSAVAAVLRGAAILMRRWKDWDWFVNLAASDYPLISQDDFLHVLSFLPRDFNFIKHTSDIGWKEYQRMLPIIVDPGLYRASKSEIFYGSSKRPLPNAYKVFTGSPSVVLSGKFIEFAVLGWDNLPRTLLLYFSNVRYSRRGYFHTLACNSREFHDTVVNSDLKFAVWDNPPGKQSRHLRMSDFEKMIASGMPFAENILSNDSVLDKIDASVLHRSQSRLAPGGWCLGKDDWGRDPCKIWGDADVLRPGPGAQRFEKLLLTLMANMTFWSNLCSFRIYHLEGVISRGCLISSVKESQCRGLSKVHCLIYYACLWQFISI